MSTSGCLCRGHHVLQLLLVVPVKAAREELERRSHLRVSSLQNKGQPKKQTTERTTQRRVQNPRAVTRRTAEHWKNSRPFASANSAPIPAWTTTRSSRSVLLATSTPEGGASVSHARARGDSRAGERECTHREVGGPAELFALGRARTSNSERIRDVLRRTRASQRKHLPTENRTAQKEGVSQATVRNRWENSRCWTTHKLRVHVSKNALARRVKQKQFYAGVRVRNVYHLGHEFTTQCLQSQQ